METNFNVNDYVKVRLTEFGLIILKNKHDSLYEDSPVERFICWTAPKTDGEGYSTFQLHRLMNVFGEYMDGINGMPFDGNIKLIIG